MSANRPPFTQKTDSYPALKNRDDLAASTETTSTPPAPAAVKQEAQSAASAPVSRVSVFANLKAQISERDRTFDFRF